MSDQGRPGGILTVCTANICRSPLAALHLREVLRSGVLDGVPIFSAGVRGRAGAEMCAVARSRLDDPTLADEHVARELTSVSVMQADLVITMEKAQRGDVARLAPGHQHKIFTLREAEAMIGTIALEGDLPMSVQALAARMQALRGFVRPVVPERVEPSRRLGLFRRREPAAPDDGLSIDDGHNVDPDAHRLTADTVRELTGRIGAALAR